MFKFLTGFPALASIGIPPLPNLRDSTDEEIEHHWLRVKAMLLQTFVYSHEERYRLLRDQAVSTLDAILERHRRAFDYSPEVLMRHARINHMRGERIGEGLSWWEFKFDEESREETATELLLAMCYLSYRSPRKVFPDSDYAMRPSPSGYCRTIEYLIENRQSTRALFLKGLICKYGIEPMEDVPDFVTAKDSLALADKQGEPLAKQELTYLNWHGLLARDTGRAPTPWPVPRAKAP